METIPAAKPVPADELFPSWRGREPYEDKLRAVSEALNRRRPGLAEAVALLPFERFESAARQTAAVFVYHDIPEAAASLLEGLPEALRSPWLCALLLWHIGRFEHRFADTGYDPEFALHYVDAFHRIIDQVEADSGFADLGSDSFMKDLWLTRLVMIPAFAQVWWPHSGLSARAILRGGLASLTHVFLRCGGRRPFLEGHTHDPVAKAYWNENGWREALRLAALALPALRRAKGVFGSAWFYDPAVKQVSPRIAFAQDLQAGCGAHRFRIGSNAAAVANATATSAERRNRYRDGSYLPTDYAIVWSRKDLIRAYGTPSSRTTTAAA